MAKRTSNHREVGDQTLAVRRVKRPLAAFVDAKSLIMAGQHGGPGSRHFSARDLQGNQRNFWTYEP